jgi:large subunit ribosomal protein L10
MALSKSQKQDVVSEVTELIGQSKMTVIAKYQGINVKALQGLRKEAKNNGTKVKVVKNRLVVQALKATDSMKDIDTSLLEGMLLYAFNSEDEVAAAQVTPR